MTTTAQTAFAPSGNIAQLKESATIAVSARARALRAAGRTVIDLGAGEPDFATPPFVVEAAERAVRGGATHYTATEGIPPLREAIAAEANSLYRGTDRISAADVVVSTGSKQSLFNACFSLFGPGDEVLIPTPSWTSYYEIVALARATPVPVYGEATRGLKVTAAQLADAATPRTRGLMLNSPCNPTGSVYSEQELRDIAALAADRGWWLISDEIYRRISYEGPARSVLEVIGDRDRVVYVNGVAKAYAMTGWRIGWSVAPRALTQSMAALQSHTTSNPATPSQHAALAALTDTAAAEQAIAAMVREFKARRDAVCPILDRAQVPYVHPAGAFYLYIDVGRDGSAFAAQLMDRQGVAVVPGVAFLTPNWVRASYAAPMETVAEGVTRLVKALAG
jgi:aspartate aminotransferase